MKYLFIAYKSSCRIIGDWDVQKLISIFLNMTGEAKIKEPKRPKLGSEYDHQHMNRAPNFENAKD